MNPNDYMNEFTHYRYSIINSQYKQFLFLIENAAIHDAACLVHMPLARNYVFPLAKRFSDVDLNSCKLRNKIEHQTKKHNE